MANKPVAARRFANKLLRVFFLAFAVSVSSYPAGVSYAQANFYEGKTVRIIVGLARTGVLITKLKEILK